MDSTENGWRERVAITAALTSAQVFIGDEIGRLAELPLETLELIRKASPESVRVVFSAPSHVMSDVTARSMVRLFRAEYEFRCGERKKSPVPSKSIVTMVAIPFLCLCAGGVVMTRRQRY